MERDVNYALLIIILGLLVAIVGMSIYYQSTYKGLSSAYDATLKQLQARISELAEKEQELNKTERDFEALRVKYTSLEREKAEVDKQLLETKAQRDALNQTLATYRAKIAELYNATRSLRSAIDELRNKINANETLKNALSVDINWVEDRMEAVEQKVMELQALP